jgi:hypothetical protein
MQHSEQSQGMNHFQDAKDSGSLET